MNLFVRFMKAKVYKVESCTIYFALNFHTKLDQRLPGTNSVKGHFAGQPRAPDFHAHALGPVPAFDHCDHLEISSIGIYTKTVDRVEGAQIGYTKTRNILCYSPPSNSCGICARKCCNFSRINEFKSSFCAILSHCFSIYQKKYLPKWGG